jgi:DNA-directed RNA polymerase delta subunit
MRRKMRNIGELVEEIVTQTGKAENVRFLADTILEQHSGYDVYDRPELLALIHTTLSVDGRFVFINELWDVKSRYSTIDLAKIREEYVKNISDSEMEDLDTLIDELDSEEDLDAFEGPDKDFDDLEDDSEFGEEI